MADHEPQVALGRVTSVSVRLGALLAVVGGFLDAYTYVSRNGVFANSQTGNIVLLAVEAIGHRWGRSLAHLPPILAFVAGVAVAETLKRPALARLVRRPVRAALLLEMGVLLLMGLLPASTPDIIVTVSIAFVCSLQISTFRTLIKWSYSTAVTTGNLRTFAEASYHALVDRDREAVVRARAFAAVISAFILGAVVGAYLTRAVGTRSIWAAACVLAMAVALFVTDEWRVRAE
jgi:uncharacterized membrane protein YoaK (UPF0700 family)